LDSSANKSAHCQQLWEYEFYISHGAWKQVSEDLTYIDGVAIQFNAEKG